MGDPKRPKKKYSGPAHPWIKERIEDERKLVNRYGLKNKREVWRTKTLLGRYRRQARNLLARLRTGDEQARKEEQQVLKRLERYGLVKAGAHLDDVLALTVEDLLQRRLQTLVYMRGLAHTPHQARQFITHGHIAIDGRRVTVPGYLVKTAEENAIGYYYKSPLTDEEHPVRPSPIKRLVTGSKETQVEKQINIKDIGGGTKENTEGE